MLEVKVIIDPQTAAIMRKLSGMASGIPAAIQRGMDSALTILKDKIVNQRLSGQGPYDPSAQRLGTVTGTLRGSVKTGSVIQGDKVLGYLSSDVIYAPVHEYGKVISAKNAPFLVFKVLGQVIRTKQVTIPERAPFRTEVEAPQTAELISTSIQDEIQNLTK